MVFEYNQPVTGGQSFLPVYIIASAFAQHTWRRGSSTTLQTQTWPEAWDYGWGNKVKNVMPWSSLSHRADPVKQRSHSSLCVSSSALLSSRCSALYFLFSPYIEQTSPGQQCWELRWKLACAHLPRKGKVSKLQVDTSTYYKNVTSHHALIYNRPDDFVLIMMD